MVSYEQLELFDLTPYKSGNSTPGIYMVAQSRKLQEIENQQLELNLFPDEPDEGYFNLKQAA